MERWILNLDAEEELAALRAGVSYAPDARLGPIIERARAQLAEAGWSNPPRGEVSLWCPTPRALAELRSRRPGATPPVGPPVDALIAANARETFVGLSGLGGELVVEEEEALRGAVARRPPSRPSGRAPAWILRRSLAASGRGRCVAEIWTAEVAAWGRRSLELGPVHVLPFVDVELELSINGWLSEGGHWTPRAIAEQSVRGGAWRSSRELPPGRHPLARAALADAAQRVAQTLSSIGYFGPLGVDGFAWRDATGEERFAAGTDVNARYTMSSFVGAGAGAEDRGAY